MSEEIKAVADALEVSFKRHQRRGLPTSDFWAHIAVDAIERLDIIRARNSKPPPEAVTADPPKPQGGSSGEQNEVEVLCAQGTEP